MKKCSKIFEAEFHEENTLDIDNLYRHNGGDHSHQKKRARGGVRKKLPNL